jgi:hypothetical protein
LIALRPATPEDRFRIRRWLADPAAQDGWRTPAAVEAEMTLAMGSPAALVRIIECDGTPIGYAYAADAGLWAGEHPPLLAPGSWQVDLVIAVAQHRTPATSAAALRLLTEEIFATTLAVACCGLVTVRNEAAVRAYEQAGFRWQQIWHDPLSGPAWVMVRERP